VPALKELAATQPEPLFLVAQLVVMVAFIALAVKNFHAAEAAPSVRAVSV
jgi:hypothetical protein